MRRTAAAAALALAAALAVALGVAGAGAQDDFQPDRVRLLAIFRTLDHGEKAFLSGQFRHLDDPDAEAEPYADRRIVLEEAPFPHTTWTAVAETTSDQEGYFSFTRQPTANTRYRVRTEDPPVTSEEPIVRVRVVATLAADRGRTVAGRRVELTGTVTPAHDGTTAILQRKEEGSERWREIDRVQLEPGAQPGTSAFELRVRARRTAEYRVRVAVADGDHLPDTTGAVRVVAVPRRR